MITSSAHSRPLNIPTTSLLACAAFILSQAGTFSQEVLAPAPPEALPAMPYTPGIGSPGDSEVGFLAEASAAGESALEYGIRKLHPRLFYQFSYGNRLQATAGGPKENSIIQRVTPAMTLQLGRKWAIDYAPTLTYYSSDQFRDTLEHSVIFSGGTTYQDWAFGLSQAYQKTDSPRIETGAQTQQDRFSTALSALHQLNSKLGLQLGLNQSIRLSDQYIDVYQWSTMNWLDYQIAQRFSTGVGLGGGYVDVSEGLDSTFEQLMGRLNFAPSEKLSFEANGGGDIRQYLDSNQDALVNPIYGLTANYHLFEPTTIFVSGSRAVNASFYQNQVNENTRLSAGVRQRLLKELALSVSGGYRLTSYTEVNNDYAQAREDDGYFFSSRLSTRVRKLTTGIFYRWSFNNSDARGYSYDSFQVGFDLGYRF